MKSPMPMEPEPSVDEVTKELSKEAEDMVKMKALGRLKVQKDVLDEKE